jgi:hypothetical protein
MSSMIKDKYEEYVENYMSKPERDRIVGRSFIPSYGKIPVINKKYDEVVDKINQKITSLKEMNKDLTDLQKSYIDILESKIDYARLKILYDNIPTEKNQSLSSFLLSLVGFRDWCGAGTNVNVNIQRDLDDPTRMFQVDSICLKHDIAYSKAKTKEEQHKADVDMLYELGQKYIFNYESNFLTGDYKTDFTNWSSSFKTVSNYLLSFAETIFTGYLIKSNAMLIFNILKNEFITTRYNLFNSVYDTGLELPQPSNIRDFRTRGMLPEMAQQIYQTSKTSLYSLYKEFGINLFFSTVLKDKFLAIGTFLLMSGKLALEKFGIKDFTPIAEHKISEEDIVALESLYKELENEFEIKPTEPEPPVEKEPINIETLKSDITDIIDTNIRYNETKTVIFDAVIDDMDELISQPEPEPTETIAEPSDNLKKLQDLYDLTVKLFKKIDYDYETVEPIVPNLPEDIKKTKDTTLIPNIPEDVPRLETPLLPEDIKTSGKTSTLIQEEIEPQEKEEIKINYKNEL